jgi:hypothetical protein
MNEEGKMETGKNFVQSCFETFLLAVVIGVLEILAVKAQDNVDFEALNGLFTPTESARFFQAGRVDFAREVEIFNHPERYLGDNLLQINPELIEQMNRFGQSMDFRSQRGEYELYLHRQSKLLGISS